MSEAFSDVPTVSEFDPRLIPFQYEVISDVRVNFNYDLGAHEFMCSGALGSSKTMLGAHLAVTHCIENPGSGLLIGRRTMPSLKDTLLQRILDHLGDEIEFDFNKSRGIISFENGSKIMPYTWADKKYKKVRSMEVNCALIEELTENEDLKFLEEIVMRVGRSRRIKEKWIGCLTNPDSPTHPAHKYFIESQSLTRHVYYSKTSDNPFLPTSYVEKLRRDLDPKMAMRMLDGLWVAVNEERVYYSYDESKNRIKAKYKVNTQYPIHIAFDFNIGEGKPLSACLFQYIGGVFHFFAEVIVHGSRTEDALEEMYGRGLFEFDAHFVINGDATGKHKDTRSRHSDYEIIKKFLDNTKNKSGYVRYSVDVPLTNPKVRERHNTVNGQICNTYGERRVLVYDDCPVLDEGWRLVKLKPGANYIEDDSKYYQHVTTAAGYGMIATLRGQSELPITMMKR